MHQWLTPGRGMVLTAALTCLSAAPASGDAPGLAVLMHQMQTYAHKTQLSIEARNEPLAHFYLHELEETSEYIADNIATYDDYPVGQLAREMLLPAIEALEGEIETGEWVAAAAGFQALLDACNACHKVTAHGYIRVAPASGNPYAQDFAVSGQ